MRISTKRVNLCPRPAHLTLLIFALLWMTRLATCRTITCSEFDSTRLQSTNMLLLSTIVPSTSCSDTAAGVELSCDNGDANGANVTVYASSPSCISFREWKQDGGALQIVPHEHADLRDVSVDVREGTNVNATIRSLPALSLVAATGSVSNINFTLDEGVYLSHTRGTAVGGMATAASVHAAEGITDVRLSARGVHIAVEGSADSAALSLVSVTQRFAKSTIHLVDSLLNVVTDSSPVAAAASFVGMAPETPRPPVVVSDSSVVADSSVITTTSTSRAGMTSAVGVVSKESHPVHLERVALVARHSMLVAYSRGYVTERSGAAALGAVSNCPRLGEPDDGWTVDMDTVRFELDSTTISAVVDDGRGPAVACAGVALGCYNNQGNLTRSHLRVRHSTIRSVRGNVTVRGGVDGVAVAGFGVAVVAFGSQGEGETEAIVTVNDMGISLEASNATVSAKNVAGGTAAAAAGVAVSLFSAVTSSTGSRLTVDVNGVRLSAVGSRLDASAGTSGSAATAGGIASGCRSFYGLPTTWLSATDIGFDVSRSRMSASVANSGSGASAAGAASGTYTARNPAVARFVVDKASVDVHQSELHSNAGDDGTAAASAGFASGQWTSTKGTTSVTSVSATTVDVRSSNVTAQASNEGAVASAAAVTCASFIFTYGSSTNLTVEGASFGSTHSRLVAQVKLFGTAGAALGLALGVYHRAPRTTPPLSALHLHDVDVLAKDSVVSVSGGGPAATHATAGSAAALGFAIAGRSTVTRDDAVAIRACRSDVAVYVGSHVTDTRSLAVVLGLLLADWDASAPTPLGVMNASAANTVVEVTTASAPQSTAAVASSAAATITNLWLNNTLITAVPGSCLSAEHPRLITVLTSNVTCADVGLSTPPPSAYEFYVDPQAVLRHGSALERVSGTTAFPGGTAVSPPSTMKATDAENDACAPLKHRGEPIRGRTPTHTPRVTSSNTLRRSVSHTVPQAADERTETVQRHALPSSLTQTQVPPPTPLSAASATKTLPRPAVHDTRSATASIRQADYPPVVPPATPTVSMAIADGTGNDVPEPPLDPRHVPASVRDGSVVTAVVAVAAVTAVVPGAISPGAAGAPARFAALAQLLLCEEIEDPHFTVLPGPVIFEKNAGVFAQLAERAASVAIFSWTLSLIAMLILRRDLGGSTWAESLAQAIFIVPPCYAGPAVTGVAAQLASLFAQRDTLSPVVIGDDSNETVGTLSGYSVALACLSAVLMWVHLVFVLRITFLGPGVPARAQLSSKSLRASDSLRGVICSGLRLGPRRKACGCSSEYDEARPDGGGHVVSRSVTAIVVIEVAVAHVFELLAGVRGPKQVCQLRAIAAVLVAAGFFVFVLAAQPFHSRVENSFHLALAGVQLAAGLLLGAGLASSDEGSEQAQEAGEWVTTAGVWIVVVEAFALAILELRDLRSPSAVARAAPVPGDAADLARSTDGRAPLLQVQELAPAPVIPSDRRSSPPRRTSSGAKDSDVECPAQNPLRHQAPHR